VKIEHMALNVADPVAMAAWYVEHLGMSVVHEIEAAPYTHFLGDTGEYVLLEIYNNPADQVPLYVNMDPLILHLAFESVNPAADAKRLIDAGARWVEEVHLPSRDAARSMGIGPAALQTRQAHAQWKPFF